MLFEDDLDCLDEGGDKDAGHTGKPWEQAPLNDSVTLSIPMWPSAKCIRIDLVSVVRASVKNLIPHMYHAVLHPVLTFKTHPRIWPAL